VTYERFTPLTETEQYYVQESFSILSPRLWFNGAFLAKIGVLLYDSSALEENGPVTTKKSCAP
jgi:hypothetical protein